MHVLHIVQADVEVARTPTLEGLAERLGRMVRAAREPEVTGLELRELELTVQRLMAQDYRDVVDDVGDLLIVA